MAGPNETIFTPTNIVHDVEIIIAWIKDNWNFGTKTYIPLPDEIWYDKGQGADDEPNKIRHVWMYKSCIKIEEEDTDYALLDMYGNADAINDTPYRFTIYSKVDFNTVEGMFLRTKQLLQKLAHENDIGVYAFTQLTNKLPIKKRFFGKLIFNMLLTRRGKGHA